MRGVRPKMKRMLEEHLDWDQIQEWRCNAQAKKAEIWYRKFGFRKVRYVGGWPRHFEIQDLIV